MNVYNTRLATRVPLPADSEQHRWLDSSIWSSWRRGAELLRALASPEVRPTWQNRWWRRAARRWGKQQSWPWPWVQPTCRCQCYKQSFSRLTDSVAVFLYCFYLIHNQSPIGQLASVTHFHCFVLNACFTFDHQTFAVYSRSDMSWVH